MFLGIYNLPLAVTMIGMLLSVGCCFLAALGETHLAIICLIYAGIADLFDGLVARKLKVKGRASEFGVQIDSLVDVVSFAITPVWFVVFFVGLGWPTYIVGVVYIFATLMRLAWFNISGTQNVGKKRFYTGLPCTYAALIFPLVFALGLLLEAYAGLDRSATDKILLTGLLVMAFCFLSTFKVPKPNGIFYIIFPLIAFGLTAFFALWAAP